MMIDRWIGRGVEPAEEIGSGERRYVGKELDAAYLQPQKTGGTGRELPGDRRVDVRGLARGGVAGEDFLLGALGAREKVVRIARRVEL
jgi:hypothetical protein